MGGADTRREPQSRKQANPARHPVRGRGAGSDCTFHRGPHAPKRAVHPDGIASPTKGSRCWLVPAPTLKARGPRNFWRRCQPKPVPAPRGMGPDSAQPPPPGGGEERESGENSTESGPASGPEHPLLGGGREGEAAGKRSKPPVSPPPDDPTPHRVGSRGEGVIRERQ